jgi:predicted RNA-binding protein with PIN domain
MSKDLVVDGYNVLLRWRRGGLKRGPGNIERARDALVQWVARRVSEPARVTLVFDAGQGSRSGLVDSRLAGVRVVFAEGMSSADDWIARECDSRRGDKSLRVVSNDRAVQLAARQARVEYCSTDDWIAELTSFGLREEITEETDFDPPVPSSTSLSTELTGIDLDEFRAAMGEEPRVPAERTDSPSGKPVESKEKQPPQKNVRSEGDLSNFYREMRQWPGDGSKDS